LQKMVSSQLLCVLGLLWATRASAHGKLSVPQARGSGSRCAHCHNGGGICGDGSGEQETLNNYRGPQETWTARSIVPIKVLITAHHKGHYELRICDQIINSSMSDPEACLNKWKLQRASAAEVGVTNCQQNDQRPVCQPIDTRYPERFYLPPPSWGSTQTFYVKVPEGLECNECTLQWWWWSANSCIPADGYGCYREILLANGYDANAWGVHSAHAWNPDNSYCPDKCKDGPRPQYPVTDTHCGCGEQFRNCADIAVLRSLGSTTATTRTSASTSSAASSTITATRTSTTTTTMMRTSTTTTTTTLTTATQGSLACQATAAGEIHSATDMKCSAACQSLPAGRWPCAGQLCDCSGTTTRRVTTSTGPVTASTTTKAQGKSCTPTPGSPPNGATASNCAQCAAGYPWWPCNTNPAICTCTPGSLAEIKAHSFRKPEA